MTAFWKQPLRRQIVVLLVWMVGLFGLYLFAEWYAVSGIGYGGLFVLFMAHLIFLPWLLAWIAAPVSLGFLFWRRARPYALTVLIGSVMVIPMGIASIRLAAPIRPAAFQRLAERSQPLVEAIEQYVADHGEPPPNLESLIPRYLPEVPATGMTAYPEYHYSTGHDPERWDGNPWVLYVNTSSGGINFDMFLYFPLQNYAERGYGGVLKRMGKWAYVYE